MTAAGTDISPGGDGACPGEGPLVVFAGGGTGGHLYPALSVVEAIRESAAGARFVFFATDRPVDREVLGAAGQNFVAQGVMAPAMAPWRWPAFVRAWRASVRLCRLYFEVHRPAVVIGTGAYASVPAVRQALRMGVPTALLNPDVIPGRANRWLASRVDVVFAQWGESKRHFPSRVNVEVAGCPVRLAVCIADRAAGLDRFGLSLDRRTLLVTGASQGARSINQALVCLAGELAGLTGWQVLHQTGETDLQTVHEAYSRAGVAAVCIKYTDQMGEALAAADLVISRAGASTLAELTATGTPSILLPYPYHRDMHQLANAEVLAARGAARICRDEIDGAKTAKALGGPLLGLMADEQELSRMSQAARALGAPGAADVIARSVIGMSQ